MSLEFIAMHEPIAGPEQHTTEWLEVHRTHVTASRMAAILGQSEYSTALDEFLVMTGRKKPFEGNEWTRRGNRYEPAIIGDYCEQEGRSVEYPVPLYFHPTIAGIAASPDAIILPNRRGLVEAKWSMSPSIAAQLGEEETDHIPTTWLIQAQTQMSVMGAEFVEFAVLLYGRLRVYLVQRHEGLIATIEQAAVEFLERVKNDDPPEADYQNEGAANALRILYGLDEGKEIDLDADGYALWERRQYAALTQSAAEKEKKALDAEMLAMMQGAAVAWTPDGGKIKRTVVTVPEKIVKGYSFERFFYSKAKGTK